MRWVVENQQSTPVSVDRFRLHQQSCTIARPPLFLRLSLFIIIILGCCAVVFPNEVNTYLNKSITENAPQVRKRMERVGGGTLADSNNESLLLLFLTIIAQPRTKWTTIHRPKLIHMLNHSSGQQPLAPPPKQHHRGLPVCQLPWRTYLTNQPPPVNSLWAMNGKRSWHNGPPPPAINMAVN